MADWRAWHEDYDDPTSRLFQRLVVVRGRLHQVLDAVDGPVRLLALCAGDARDVVPVLSARADRDRVTAVLVEKDEELAARAEAAAVVEGLAIEVRCGDAGEPSTFADVLPVDVLMLCGIFGNVERPAVHAIASRVPSMVRGGGHVIWTRGGDKPDDPRPEVRRWFVEAGMPEVAFDGEPKTYGVGVNRVEATPATPLGPERLFTFIR